MSELNSVLALLVYKLYLFCWLRVYNYLVGAGYIYY